MFLYIEYYAATAVFEVTLRGRIVILRSLIRRTALMVDDLRMFDYSGFGYQTVNLRSARRVFHLLSPMDQLHDLIARVRSMNPHVVTRGI